MFIKLHNDGESFTDRSKWRAVDFSLEASLWKMLHFPPVISKFKFKAIHINSTKVFIDMVNIVLKYLWKEKWNLKT